MSLAREAALEWAIQQAEKNAPSIKFIFEKMLEEVEEQITSD